MRAQDVFGEATDDRELLAHCASGEYVLVTHDKKDFGGATGQSVQHAGVVIYTDSNFLRNEPETAVRTIERVLEHYPPSELGGSVVWLPQWRE